MFRAWGLALVLCSCTEVANEPVANPASKLDEAVFRCNVEPILARQCSYNGCHGTAGSPLRVYSPGKLRATTPKTIDEQIAPLTEAEHHANFESAAGFNFGVTEVDNNFLLRKPLPASDGGFEHLGGAIYTSTSDPQFTAIRAWLLGQGTCAP